jgi:hypothetical protein
MKKLLLALLLILPINAMADILPKADRVAYYGIGYIVGNVMLTQGYSKKQVFWTNLGLGIFSQFIEENRGAHDQREHAEELGAQVLGSYSAVFVYKWELKNKQVQW